MPNISITPVYIGRNFSASTVSGSGYAHGNDAVTARVNAKTAANNAAENATLNWSSTGNNTTGGIGRKQTKNITTTVTQGEYDQVTEDYTSSYTWSVNGTGSLHQVHLKFNVTGLSNIESATLKITGGKSKITYRACAPASSSSNISDNVYYYRTDSIFSSTQEEFTINAEETYVDITNQLNQCINTGKGVIVITLKDSTPSSSNYISNPAFTLSYVSSVSVCTPPTSVQDNGTGYIVPGNEIKIKWSGAAAGENNPIIGYRLYWKIGSAPTKTNYTGFHDFNTTSTSGTITLNSPTRGDTYYFKVCTKGTYAINNERLSSISNESVNIKVNQLPSEPTVRYTNRLKSSGATTVKFTVTAGSDSNTGQTKTLYYSSTVNGTKTKFTSPLAISVNPSGATANYYFWTYDGYEFSNTYATATLTRQTAPTGTLTINYNTDDCYNVKASGQVQVTASGTINKYSWRIYINNIDKGEIATTQTFNNYNLVNTISNITFGDTYYIKLQMTDDIGEVVTLTENSSNVFPNTPTYTLVNGIEGHKSYFGSELQLEYLSPSTDFSLKEVRLFYKLKNISVWNDSIVLNGTNIDCSSNFVRGNIYNFKIRFTLNNNNYTDVELKTENNLTELTRALDLTPSVSAYDETIQPFTQITSTIVFNCNGVNLNDYLGNLNSLKISFKYNNNELNSVSTSYTSSTTEITGIIDLNNNNIISTSKWMTFINNPLNRNYQGQLQISVIDMFGDEFSSIITINFNFSNSLYPLNNLSGTLYIKDIDDIYQLLTTSNYSVFEGQQYKIDFSELKSYCSGEELTITIKDNNGKIYGTKTVQVSSAGNGRTIYTYNNGYIEFTIPKITTESSNNYFILQVENQSGLDSKSADVYKTERIHLCRCDVDAIDLAITKIEENNGYYVYFSATDFGGCGSTPRKDEYSNIKVQLYYSNDESTYNTFGEQKTITFNDQGDIVPISITGINLSEKVYFKVETEVENNFEKIEVSGEQKTPYGEKTYTREKETVPYFIFYNSIPNLAYGKNFFLINTTELSNDMNDQILVIRPISYMEGQTSIMRNKIYFGIKGHETSFEISQNGLIIDGGTWDT